MAIDTALKRLSVIQFKLPFRMTLPFPTGAITDADRITLATAYAGISGAPPVTGQYLELIYHEQRVGYPLGFT